MGAETMDSVPEGLKVSTREHQTKVDTTTPQSPGTARITAFYPGSPATGAFCALSLKLCVTCV